jgi:hypothetical protein
MKKISLLGILMLGLLATGLAWAADKDKKSAALPPVSDEKLLIKEIASDSNGDGKPDRWERYDQGVLVGVEADSNFDGKVDEKGKIQNGRVVEVEKDSDYDGKPDKWVKY